MSLSLAQDAIALLIDMAERGEIDPWDVKVIDVVDRFLQELARQEAVGREQYEANLSRSGQAFLYASMLVLLKAESLAQAETEEEPPEDLGLEEFEDLNVRQLPLNLERQLQRRAVARPPQRRRVTLKELIDQLQVMAAALEEKLPRTRVRRSRPQSKSQAIRAITQLAHQENLSEMAQELDRFLAVHWSNLSQGEPWMDFDLLLELWSEMKPASLELSQHQGPVSERVGVFWALLLLSAQSKVELSQEEFYQDLKVRTLTADAEMALGELSAIALPD